MPRAVGSRAPLSVAACLLTLAAPVAASAKHAVPGLSEGTGPDDLSKDPLTKAFGAWEGFSNGWLILDMAQVLVLSVILGAIIAYHPLVRRKAQSLEQLDQPKTFIMYSLVGALATLLARENAVFGAVIFGIGGLMRFRTDVGEAKDTGRVILVTAIGLCCGAHLFMEAILATVFAWGLVWALESKQIISLMIQGIDREHMAQSSEVYRQSLAQHGCKLLGEKKNAFKGIIILNFRAPTYLDRDGLDRHWVQTIPKELRGSVDWNIG